ncbi:MAG: caspase family protein [Sphingobacteriales bacterium]|nr:caspase family protein [Sphingobacteriales bacterium]
MNSRIQGINSCHYFMQSNGLRYFIIFLLLFIYTTALAQTPRLVLPIGHTKKVNFAIFSQDGKRLVTVSDDKTAKIWDVATGSIMADLKGHKDNITSAQFSPDGKKIVTSSDDSTAKIWNAVSGDLLFDIKGHTGYVTSAQFSPDGTRIVTSSFDSTARIWDVSTGKLLLRLTGHKDAIITAQFSPVTDEDLAGGAKILTASVDKTARIWDAKNGKALYELKGHINEVWDAQYSSDGKKIVSASFDKTAMVWDAGNGKLLATLKGHKAPLWQAGFSHDGKKVVTASDDMTAKVWDASTGKLLFDLSGNLAEVKRAQFSYDGKYIVTASADGDAKVWDASTGKLLKSLRAHFDVVNDAQFSPDGKRIATASSDKSAIIWETATGKVLKDMLGHSSLVKSAVFSPDGKNILTANYDLTFKKWDSFSGDLLGYWGSNNVIFSAEYSPANKRDSIGGKKIVTASADSTAKIWSNATCDLLVTLKGHRNWVMDAQFNPDASKVVTASWDKTARVWDANTGKLLMTINHPALVECAQFSHDGKKIVTGSSDGFARVWNALTGKLILSLKSYSDVVFSAQFSPDDKKIVAGTGYNSAVIWDAATGKMILFFNEHKDWVYGVCFSADGKKVLSASKDNTAKIWDAVTGKVLVTFTGHEDGINSARFSPDEKKIITASEDNTCRVWNAETGDLLYSFLSVDKGNHLIVDKDNRYDGSQDARKLLYFICEGEIIELNQLKDQLWVPNLAERINKGETINAKTLPELNVFHLTPEIEEINSNEEEYHFKIKVQRGGLGETVVFVNGIEAKRYKPEQLRKDTVGYELVINKNELKEFFIDGMENPVTVKTFTADNSISSRGAIVQADNTKKSTVRPNLYAVMIGVSDYKGNELDLKYAAKDATDISNAMTLSARKLLNADSNQHVFVYKLTTAADRYQLPEKKTIKALFDSIGKKATANDILMIFFAGHGVMTGVADKKQFYFLTADASTLSTTDAVKDVGISTDELSEWMKPQNIKAQKRILIFDACNSGQAINDLVKMGKEGQGFLASRSDDKTQQVKAIDKLNEKSGLFILSASASDQNAYEMGRYSQGLLTYSLLKAIKQQPDILEDGKYLNISRWFNAAEKAVTELAKESGNRQEPQMVTTTNFNIGMVDEEVMKNIVLPQEKALFTHCNFQNADENISADDLGLNLLTDQQLNDISLRGGNATIAYVSGTAAPDACTLSGRYTISAGTVNIKIFIRSNKGLEQKLELSGAKDKMDELAKLIAAKVSEWAGKKK